MSRNIVAVKNLVSMAVAEKLVVAEANATMWESASYVGSCISARKEAHA